MGFKNKMLFTFSCFLFWYLRYLRKKLLFFEEKNLFVCLQMRRTTCLSWKTSVTDWTFEGPLFGVGSVMNFKRRLASKNLEANLTSGVATGWKKAKKPFLVSWFCGSKQKNGKICLLNYLGKYEFTVYKNVQYG